MTNNPHSPVLRSWTWLGLGILTAFTACNNGPPPVVLPEWDPPVQAAAAMALYDKNSDGKIDAQEQSPGLKAALKGIDTDNDGAISEAELATRIEAFADSNVGLIGIQGMISYNGRTVPGAEIVYEPEPFLADVISPAKGVVDESGGYTVTTEAENISALQPGIYTVRISKKDASGTEKIPARYNTNSELGAEIGSMDPQDRGAGQYDWQL